MSSTHPRRRPQKGPSPQMTPLNTHSLRKSDTFHSPKGVASDLCDPLANAAFMPKRSTTSLEHLEEQLNDAGVQRVASLLERFDKAMSGKSSPATILHDPEVLPLPGFMLKNNSMDAGSDDDMDIDSKSPDVEHHHASDSGLGSSVSGSKYDDGTGLRSNTRRSVQSSVTSSHSAITKSFSALGSTEGTSPHYLGKYAVQQIEERIIKPILAESALKDFHPLIKDVPRRIGTKNITNLRDLEKTLIFLAPEFSATPASYLQFCERSIQLLHATVDCLSEQDQRRPTDRPYTNNYFLDLVEQIRRYATIMAATRQKQEAGEELDEDDYSPDEKITIQGGLSHDGRPAHLVREKDGKSIPLTEGMDDSLAVPLSAKRAHPEEDEADDDDDSVRRSMARRRKSDKAGDVAHACSVCSKEFRRPCDLTKHEKTHSRPWKCTEGKCKYHDLGWPTEKERDRHMNDRHSAAPPQFKCQFPPCSYASKRESNCKQHMEKAHGWEYKRSKCNRRKGNGSSGEGSPTTPLTPFMATPASALMATPITPFAPSPALHLHNDFDFGSTGMATPATSLGDFNEGYRRASNATADTSNMTYSSGYSPANQHNSFEEAVTPEDNQINHDVVFDQQINFGTAPFNSLSIDTSSAMGFTGYDALLSATFPSINTNVNPATHVPHLSPGGHGDMTLLSGMRNDGDEGFAEGDFGTFPQAQNDFTLFDATSTDTTLNSASVDWYQDLSSLGGQFETTVPDMALPHTLDSINFDDMDISMM